MRGGREGGGGVNDGFLGITSSREGGGLVVYILPPLFIQHSTFPSTSPPPSFSPFSLLFSFSPTTPPLLLHQQQIIRHLKPLQIPPQHNPIPITRQRNFAKRSREEKENISYQKFSRERETMALECREGGKDCVFVFVQEEELELEARGDFCG